MAMGIVILDAADATMLTSPKVGWCAGSSYRLEVSGDLVDWSNRMEVAAHNKLLYRFLIWLNIAKQLTTLLLRAKSILQLMSDRAEILPVANQDRA